MGLMRLLEGESLVYQRPGPESESAATQVGISFKPPCLSFSKCLESGQSCIKKRLNLLLISGQKI